MHCPQLTCRTWDFQKPRPSMMVDRVLAVPMQSHQMIRQFELGGRGEGAESGGFITGGLRPSRMTGGREGDLDL